MLTYKYLDIALVDILDIILWQVYKKLTTLTYNCFKVYKRVVGIALHWIKGLLHGTLRPMIMIPLLTRTGGGQGKVVPVGSECGCQLTVLSCMWLHMLFGC